MPNPLINQGVLNRVKASVSWPGFRALNVTAPYLGRAGVSLSKQGVATSQLNTMTGVVQSPNVYQPVVVTINLLKTQALCALYKAQFELSTLLGDCAVRPDVSSGGGLTPYDLTNCALETVSDQSYAGEDAGYGVRFTGVWIINSSLFDS